MRVKGLSGHLHGSPEKGFAMRARGRTLDIKQLGLPGDRISSKASHEAFGFRGYQRICTVCRLFMPISELHKGGTYYAHPWDDGVTLLHRPAAGCPVIVDRGTLKTCIPASMAGMNSPAYMNLPLMSLLTMRGCSLVLFSRTIAP